MLTEHITFKVFKTLILLINHSKGDVSEKSVVIGCCEPHMETMMTCIFNFKSFHHIPVVVGVMKFLSYLTLPSCPFSKKITWASNTCLLQEDVKIYIYKKVTDLKIFSIFLYKLVLNSVLTNFVNF